MNIDNVFRLLPPFRGKLRLADYIFDRSIKDVKITTRSGMFLLPNLKDNQYFQLFTNGAYEQDLINFIIKTLPLNGCLLDIGANIGSITIPIALARPDAKIISIEAFSQNFTFLEKNIKLNNIKNVIPLNVCCSSENDKVVKFYHHETKFGSNSFHSLHTSNYVELITKTLDKQLNELAIDRVDIIKIDTEGSEALIFRGATDVLKKYKPVILFEFNEHYENAIEGLKAGDAQQILLDEGYKLFHFEEYPKGREFKSSMVNGSAELLAIHC